MSRVPVVPGRFSHSGRDAVAGAAIAADAAPAHSAWSVDHSRDRITSGYIENMQAAAQHNHG